MIRAALGTIELGDLLRTLEGGRKSATVTVECEKVMGRIHIREGKLAYVHTDPGPHLGEYFIRFDYLTLEQVQELVALQQSQNAGTPLGYLALKRGLINQDELQDVLHAQILDALATILKQTTGELLAEPLPVEVSQIVLPGMAETSTMLMEALRRLDEWNRGGVDPDVVLRLDGDPTRHPLAGDAWSVLAKVDGVKRARSIALECEMPEEHVYHLLYELVSRGLLRESEIRPQDPCLLVIAESELNRRLLLVALERARYQVLLPQDLPSARRLILQHRPKGAILEGEDHNNVARYLRNITEAKYIPIWAVSERPPRNSWLRNDRILHIPKPFSEEDLLEAVSVIKRVM
ncbi:MAG: DUF4388 domain-containing protein [Meiothermus sp.]|nr:DUF4388 domain-containing protein [Meiothermus sp.]